MARKRNRKGQFVKNRPAARRNTYRAAAAVPNKRRTRRRTYRRNPVLAANPRRRRRTYRRNPVANPRRRRRSYRRNPPFGVSQGEIRTMAYTAGGFVGTPIVEGFVGRMLPATVASSMIGKYAVRIGAAWSLGFLTKRFAGREAAKSVFVGGAVYIISELARDVFPALFKGLSGGLGYYPRTALAGYGMGRLGQPVMRPVSGIPAAIPARLNPASRFA